MTQAIFLSYASQDADAARRICEALRAAGLEVWFDQSELRGGDAWDASIRKQIKECALFVPVVSANTNARSEGYFRLEWKLAVDRSHLMADDQTFFLPVVIDGTPELAARVPDKFRERQWTRLTDDDAVTDFVVRVTRLLSGRGPQGINAPNSAPLLESSALVRAAGTWDEGFWIAVLPFKHRGGNADVEALADGMSDEIVAGLSRFSYLRVIARGAMSPVTGDVTDVRAIGKELGARFVMEGSLRQSGTTLRVSVQLIDAATGAQLWSETYDRPFQSQDFFTLQDDLVPRIVSTVADSYGVLPHNMSRTLRGRTPDQLTPYEAALRSFGYYERISAAEHAESRACLEYAVERAPDNADCWAMLALIYVHEYSVGFNARPDPLGRTMAAAQRAVDIAPTNHYAHHALAWCLHFRKEYQAARHAAERSMALNPMDASTSARMGLMIAYQGDWTVGCAILKRSRELNPNHPVWYWWGDFFNAYHHDDYRGALEIAMKGKQPGYYYSIAMHVAVHGKLGNRDAAASALRELLAIKPDVALVIREELRKWASDQHVENIVDGLRRSGLDIPPDKAASTIAAIRAIDPSIAVLAFANRSASADDEYFSDGLADELLSVLAKIKGLRVIARTSSFAFKGKSDDVATIGQKLNVDTLLEGSVRKNGNRARISVQLVRCADGSHLWSETYDRTLDDIFAVQDDIAQCVVAELRAALLGVSPTLGADVVREIARATEARTENPEVQQKCQQARFLLEQRTRVSIENAIKRFREAIEIDPHCSSAFSGLAHALGLLSTHMPERKQDLTQQSHSAAQTALLLDPHNAGAYLALAAHALTQRRNHAEWIEAMDKALELAPQNSQVLRLVAQRHMSLGELDKAQRCLDRALAIDPLSATIRLSRAGLAILKREFELARRAIDDVIAMSPSWSMPYEELACLAQLSGDHDLFVESRAKAFELAGRHSEAAYLREHYRQGDWSGLLGALATDRNRSGITRMEAAGYLLELGDIDQAVQLLDEAMDPSSGEPTWNLTSEPRLLALRDDSRFLALAKRAGLRP